MTEREEEEALGIERCKECGKMLGEGRPNRKFCDKTCARANTRKRWREQNPKSALGELAKGTIAEANEMLVAIDLLKRGFQVYKAAFQGMSCDMLVRYPKWPFDMTMRVEVTTGTMTPKGTLSHPQRTQTNFDVLAVVVADRIVYKPDWSS